MQGIGKTRISVLFAIVTLAGSAQAAPFTIAYEGTDFPENEGWTRRTTGGGAVRSIVDGSLVLDGREDVLISDTYTRRDQSIQLEPGETFFAEWRFSLDEHVGPTGDAFVTITTDDGRWASIIISPTEVEFRLQRERIDFSMAGLTTFTLYSTDFERFDLLANGHFIFEGQFRPLIGLGPRIAWGDGTQGTSSISRWDYFRFGVIPEPTSWLCWSVLWLSLTSRRQTS